MRQAGYEKNGPRYLIDSCGWIEYYADGDRSGDFSKYIEKANLKENISPALILSEVYKKIKMAVSEEEALKAIAAVKSNTTLVPITNPISLMAAEISIFEGLPMADSYIYAHCEGLRRDACDERQALRGEERHNFPIQERTQQLIQASS